MSDLVTRNSYYEKTDLLVVDVITKRRYHLWLVALSWFTTCAICYSINKKGQYLLFPKIFILDLNLQVYFQLGSALSKKVIMKFRLSNIYCIPFFKLTYVSYFENGGWWSHFLVKSLQNIYQVLSLLLAVMNRRKNTCAVYCLII